MKQVELFNDHWRDIPSYEGYYQASKDGMIRSCDRRIKQKGHQNNYESIIAKACAKLKKGGHAVFVVGEFRDKKGFYHGFVPDTINAFRKCGMGLYNEAILMNSLASCAIRAAGNMKSSKLVKMHQNILDFVKV